MHGRLTNQMQSATCPDKTSCAQPAMSIALLSSSADLLLKAKQQHVRICRIPLVAREGATGL